ncbi:MAG: DUF2911 domain-containing protein [Candidatus Kapaibacteriota bacterium]
MTVTRSLMLALLVLSTSIATAQLKLPVLSPTSTITQEFATSKIEITYSRPSMKGRVIFGDLVPYNQVWRTGANAATKVMFGEEVVIAGTSIKPGSYSLYTVPGTSEWEVIINTNTGSWGSNGYDTKDDVVRFTIKPTTLTAPVETFTIGVGNITYNTCTIDLAWDRTHVSIPVKADNNARLMKEIEQAIERPNIPYRAAAQYYLSTNQNLDKALDYAQRSAAANPKQYWQHMLVAEIAAKVNNAPVCREAVAKVRELTKGTDGEKSYYTATQALLDSLK